MSETGNEFIRILYDTLKVEHSQLELDYKELKLKFEAIREIFEDYIEHNKKMTTTCQLGLDVIDGDKGAHKELERIFNEIKGGNI